MALIVDKFSRPIPPPPAIGSIDTIVPKRIMDSLLQVKLKVAIHPKMESAIDESGFEGLPEVFKKLIDRTSGPKFIKSVEGIKSKKGHSVLLADTLELKKSCDFDDFYMLYRFSEIWYNEDKTKALFEVGISQSCLAGFATIFCLEKKKGKWVVAKSVQTTIW